MADYELNRELRETKREQELIQLELSKEHKRIANLIRQDMGKDMKDVLSGKKKVTLPFKERMKYILRKIFNTI